MLLLPEFKLQKTVVDAYFLIASMPITTPTVETEVVVIEGLEAMDMHLDLIIETIWVTGTIITMITQTIIEVIRTKKGMAELTTTLCILTTET